MRGSFISMLLVCLGVSLSSGCAKYDGEFVGRECVSDADCPHGYHCDRDIDRCRKDCVPDCDGKCCGSDGCGGICTNGCSGSKICDRATCRCEDALKCERNEDCPQKYWCDRTVWECRPLDCIPNCTGKCCGSDSCDDTCPDVCPAGFYCDARTCQCETWGCVADADCLATQCCIQGICTNMNCGPLECGPDPVCGRDCGTCQAGYHCDQGVCERDVTCNLDVDCLNPPTQCCTNGVCVNMACGARECGPDPVCHKECGPCAGGRTCRNGSCVLEGDGSPGDPCPFDTVNASASYCNAGLECLGVPADGTAGACPSGLSTQCTSLLPEWNIDCVDGNCGASFCSQVCYAGGNCPMGFIGQDVGDPPTCFCIPQTGGYSPPGSPCPWGNVNAEYDECMSGLACLGNDDTGTCPGGSPAECMDIPASYNPDCENGLCGFSFCSEECNEQGNCPGEFEPQDVAGQCYCIPFDSGTAQLGEPCEFGEVNPEAGRCAAGLVCLGFGPDSDAGVCPDGDPDECDRLSSGWNPDCVDGVCGASFCSDECEAQGNCPAGFMPMNVGGTCYCIPA